MFILRSLYEQTYLEADKRPPGTAIFLLACPKAESALGEASSRLPEQFHQLSWTREPAGVPPRPR